MAGGFAAEVVAAGEHPLEHVAVADGGANEFDADIFQETFETEFDITVATMLGLARRPSSFQLCAITASS